METQDNIFISALYEKHGKEAKFYEKEQTQH